MWKKIKMKGDSIYGKFATINEIQAWQKNKMINVKR